MILNESLDFDRVDDVVRLAFLRRPEKVLLKSPVRLYRWTNRPLLEGQGVSPWWSFVEPRRLPSGALAEGFRVAEERARRLGKTHREYDRTRAAISEQFRNTMAHLIVVQLTTDAWALAGLVSGQPEFAKERTDLQHVILIGGAHQVWIPNVTLRDVQELHAIA